MVVAWTLALCLLQVPCWRKRREQLWVRSASPSGAWRLRQFVRQQHKWQPAASSSRCDWGAQPHGPLQPIPGTCRQLAQERALKQWWQWRLLQTSRTLRPARGSTSSKTYLNAFQTALAWAVGSKAEAGAHCWPSPGSLHRLELAE